MTALGVQPVLPFDGWRDVAACRGRTDIDWFPEFDLDALDALQVCWGCPVRSECLGYAIAHFENDGVFGGLLARQRRAVARRFRWRRCDTCRVLWERVPGEMRHRCGRPPVVVGERPATRVVDPRIVRATEAFDIDMVDGWDFHFGRPLQDQLL